MHIQRLFGYRQRLNLMDAGYVIRDEDMGFITSVLASATIQMPHHAPTHQDTLIHYFSRHYRVSRLQNWLVEQKVREW